MRFETFKNEIERIYNGKFNKSKAVCSIFKCVGQSITIDFYLAENLNECPNQIAQNDCFSVSFMIHLPGEWKNSLNGFITR